MHGETTLLGVAQVLTLAPHSRGFQLRPCEAYATMRNSMSLYRYEYFTRSFMSFDHVFIYFHLVKSLCRSRGRSGFRESCCSGHVTELSTV